MDAAWVTAALEWVTATLEWVTATLAGLVGVIDGVTAVFTAALTAAMTLAALVRGWRVVAKELREVRHDRAQHESTAPMADELEASQSSGLDSADEDPKEYEDLLFESPFLE